MKRGNQIPNRKPTFVKFLLRPSLYFHLIWAVYTNSKNYINSYTTKGLPVYKYQQRGNSDDVEKASIRTNLRTTSSLMSTADDYEIQGN